MISIKAEMERTPNVHPFMFLQWNDERLESDFKQCLAEVSPETKTDQSRGYTIIEQKPDIDKLKKALAKKGIAENLTVTGIVANLKERPIRWAVK